jgi:hypothetical protein
MRGVIPPQLEQTVRDLDRHVNAGGWDQVTRLFAVADTKTLLEQEPSLATQLAGGPDEQPLTTIEQDGFPMQQELDELLRGIAWPTSVIGAAISTERVMVPQRSAAQQSEHDVRITMVVMRDATRCTALRLRAHDSDDAVIIGEDLVSGLGDLLLYTLSTED